MKPTVKTDKYELWHGDCLEIMPLLAARSVDAVIADIPYGTTACKWDTVIPFEPMWAGINGVIKPSQNILFTTSQPFTSALIMSNPNAYSHQWIWEKNTSSNALLSNSAPIKNFEEIAVFTHRENDDFNDNPVRSVLRGISVNYGISNIIELFEREGRYKTKASARVHASYKMGFSGGLRFDLMDKKLFDYLSQYIDFGFDYEFLGRKDTRLSAADKRTYNPQGVTRVDRHKVVGKKPVHIGERPNQEGKEYVQEFTNYPKAIIKFDMDKVRYHPTQKPVDLLSYLIKTYTNETETVLDFTMGSGSTGVAAIQNNRYFIGIEKDAKYFEVAKDRLAKTVESMQPELQLA